MIFDIDLAADLIGNDLRAEKQTPCPLISSHKVRLGDERNGTVGVIRQPASKFI